MKLRFQRIRCSNICKIKDFDINIEEGYNIISSDDDKCLTDIIRFVLLGKTPELPEILAMKPEDDRVKTGFAELTVEIDSERYLIKLELDYAAKKSRYYVTTRKDMGVPRSALRPPPECRVDTHVLDMMMLHKDEAEKLFEKNPARAEAMVAAAAGIDKLSLIKKKAQTECDFKIRKYGRPSSNNKKVNRQNTLLNKYKLVEMNLERYRDELYASIATVKTEQNRAIGKMGALIRKVIDSQLYEACLSNKSSDISPEDLEEIIFAMRYPPFFSLQISNSVCNLQGALDDMKYPKNAVPTPIAEAISTGVCICGAELEEETRENIAKDMDRYSLQYPYYIIEEVKNSLDGFCDGTLFNHYLGKGEPDASPKELAVTGRKKPKQSKILGATVMPEITLTAQTIRDLKKQTENLKSELLFLTDMRQNNDPQSNLQACRQKIRSVTNNIKNAEQAHEFITKTEKFTSILDEVYQVTSIRVKDRLLSYVNPQLLSISKNDLFIEDINGSLIFNDKIRGREMKYASGLIFINALLKNMGMDVPFISTVDSEEMKQISLLIPVFKQMIILNNKKGGKTDVV